MFKAPDSVESGRLLMEELARFDATTLDNDSLLSLTSTLSSIIERAEVARLHALALVESRKVTRRLVGQHANVWLAADAVISRGVASGLVRTARRTRLFPVIDTALSEGRINPGHARVLTRAACHPRAGEVFAAEFELWITAAETTTDFDRFCREVDGRIKLLDQDGSYDPNADPEANQIRLARVNDDLMVKGQYRGIAAEEFEENLAVLLDRLAERMKRDRQAGVQFDEPSTAALRARAIAEALRLAVGTSASASSAGSGANAHITVVLDAETGQGTSLRTGNRLTPKFIEWLAGDAFWQALHTDPDGTPLWLGRTVRFATAAQRRVIAIRDGGCTFDNCQHVGMDFIAHHLQFWDAGGLTDLDNLPALCDWHHWLTHQRGWAMEATPDQWFIWTDPYGNKIHSQRHGRTKVRHEQLRRAQQHHDPPPQE